MFEAVVPVVVFQFDGTRHLDEKQLSSSVEVNDDNSKRTIYKSIEKHSNASYFDRLNSWLGQILQRDCPTVRISTKYHFVKLINIYFLIVRL